MAKRHTAAERIAFLIGYDLAEMSDYRYQSTRYTVAVYAIGDSYYCAPGPGKKLPDVGYNWEVVGESYGSTVYRADAHKDNRNDD